MADPGPPPPPLKTAEGLAPGDVLLVSQYVTPRDGKDPYWWKTFRVVLDVDKRNKKYATLMILKLHPELEKDVREVDFKDEKIVITQVLNIPQGVAAMLMKHTHTGLIRLSPED